ncbi:hypothetical protein FRC08_005810 [Ceratobasidium sp. 394]|nr:hypothetical protein FRC08_005810 [Ceratobasidium sp. 394]
MSLDKGLFLDNPVPGVFTNGCIVILPPTLWTVYFPHLVYDTILFGLIVRKVWVSTREFGSTPLMQRLVENSTLHFGVLIVLILFACIAGTTKTLNDPPNASGIIVAVSSVVCSRIIFSLHTFADEERKQGLPEPMDRYISGELRAAIPMTELNSATGASFSNGRASVLHMVSSKSGL